MSLKSSVSQIKLTPGPRVKHLQQSILSGLSMKGSQSKTRSGKPAPGDKRGLIIEVWNRLGRTAIGADELRKIQRSVRDKFGEDADESPAAIARVLADEGAELRHPEVIEFDACWREAKLEKDGRQFKGLEDFLVVKPLRLKQAEALIKKLEQLRQRAEKTGDRIAAREARTIAVSAREVAELLAKDRKLSQPERDEQAEITEWLKVWIQTPSLFADWLDLRRRSPEFQQKFPS